MANLTASPAKLNNGTWGARASGVARVGDTITITTNAGKTWDAKVTAVIWAGNGASIVATASLDRAPSASQSTRYVQRCYYGHTSPKHGCRDCFDEFDC